MLIQHVITQFMDNIYEKSIIVFVLISVVICVVIVSIIEKNKLTPMDRFKYQIEQEQGITGNYQVNLSDKNSETNVFYSEYESLKNKVVSYKVYDDSNILDQIQYTDTYYLDGEYPDTNYIYSGMLWHQMYADYPEVEEYLNLDYEEAINSDFDFDSFMLEHEEEYTVNAHPDARYVFVTVEITNVSENRVDANIVYDLCIENDVFAYESKYNEHWSEATCLIYLDYIPDLSGDELVHRRTWYSFEPGETHVFTMGFLFRAYPCDDTPLLFTDNDIYYYCNPVGDEHVTSPKEFINSVCLNELE